MTFSKCVFFIFFQSIITNLVCHAINWDYLVFAQRWPPSACLDIEYGKCCIPKDTSNWIIHGLWPSNVNGDYPSFCNKSWPFDIAEVKPIVANLGNKWPNIMESSSDLAFWTHEWMKHGTCATSLEDLDGILKYFNKTLGLHDVFNIYEILKSSSVAPGASKVYSASEIENILYVHLKAKGKVFCKSHKDYSYPLIDTIYICMNKKFDVIDCNIPNEPSCDSASVLYLPMNSNKFVNPEL